MCILTKLSSEAAAEILQQLTEHRGGRKETESRYKNWREAQSKMAAAG